MKNFAPRWVSILGGDRFDVDRVSEISFVIVWAFSFFEGDGPNIFWEVNSDNVYIHKSFMIWSNIIIHVS